MSNFVEQFEKFEKEIYQKKFVFEDEKTIQKKYDKAQKFCFEATILNMPDYVKRVEKVITLISHGLWYSKISIGSLSRTNINGEEYVSSEAIFRKLGYIKSSLDSRKKSYETLESKLQYSAVVVYPEPPFRKPINMFPISVVNKYMNQNKMCDIDFDFNKDYFYSTFIRDEFGRLSTDEISYLSGFYKTFSPYRLIFNLDQILLLCSIYWAKKIKNETLFCSDPSLQALLKEWILVSEDKNTKPVKIKKLKDDILQKMINKQKEFSISMLKSGELFAK